MPEEPNQAHAFHATIRRQGPNPYVDVPEAISKAFAGFARAGRISFEGALNGVPIRGTLIPVGGGRHRLYLNGGVRSAAHVGVGDAVALEIRAVHPETVNPPPDVAEALRTAAGALGAFDALTPSHRRELLRYIDDARTPANRQRRIAATIGHLLGEPAPSERRRTEPTMWTCPRCGNAFVTPNQYHSCERHDLAEPFAGKPPAIWGLFERFRAMVEGCGPVTLVAYRDRVAFMVRVRFAGVVPRMRWLEIGFWLTRRVEHPRFHKVETIYPNAHIHLLRVAAPEELDDQVAAWIEEAYAVGCQAGGARRGL